MKSTPTFIRIFLSLLLTAMPMLGMSAQDVEEYVMVVELAGDDSEIVEYKLNEKPVVSFEKDSLVISTSDIEYIGYSKVSRIYFDVKYVPTDIDNVSDQKVSIKITPSEIVFCNVPTNSKVTAFTLDGKVMPADAYATTNGVAVSIASYPKGVYIFRINNRSFKIIKK